MEIQATVIKGFELVHEGYKLGLFRIESEWEGLMKLSQIDGSGVIICAPTIPQNGFANVFDSIFLGIAKEPRVMGMQIIMCSPEITAILKRHPNKSDECGGGK